jgi:hypothetical protein
MPIPKTSMFVPEPVISLSIKPKGLETPNFSRALNRFQKEDPTFKVHIDHESKQVGISIFRVVVSGSDLISGRPSFLVWESFTLRFTSNA